MGNWGYFTPVSRVIYPSEFFFPLSAPGREGKSWRPHGENSHLESLKGQTLKHELTWKSWNLKMDGFQKESPYSEVHFQVPC